MFLGVSVVLWLIIAPIFFLVCLTLTIAELRAMLLPFVGTVLFFYSPSDSNTKPRSIGQP